MAANWRFLSRLRAADQARGGSAPSDVARTEIVANSGWYASRELAPAARHWGFIALSAGNHAGIRISGRDNRGPATQAQVLVHDAQLAATNMIVFLSAPITEAAATEVTPGCLDVSADLRPRIFEVQVAAANLPAFATGVTSVYPGGNVGSLASMQLPMSVWWNDGNVRWLYILNATIAADTNYKAMWQAVRL